MAGYPGRNDLGPLDQRTNAHSALSGNEMAPSLAEGNSSEDQAIRGAILSLLSGHTEVDFSRIEVAVKEGFVSLTGVVNEPQAKSTIEGLVASVDGVLDVVGLIEIDETSAISRSVSGQGDLSIPGPR